MLQQFAEATTAADIEGSGAHVQDILVRRPTNHELDAEPERDAMVAHGVDVLGADWPAVAVVVVVCAGNEGRVCD